MQAFQRGRTAQHEFWVAKQAAIMMQRYVRRKVAQRICVAARLEREHEREVAEVEAVAASSIAASWRGHKTRQEYEQAARDAARAEQEHEAATRVQACWRGYESRTQQLRDLEAQLLATESEMRRQLAAAVTLQAFWRGRSIERDYVATKVASIRCSSMWWMQARCIWRRKRQA